MLIVVSELGLMLRLKFSSGKKRVNGIGGNEANNSELWSDGSMIFPAIASPKNRETVVGGEKIKGRFVHYPTMVIGELTQKPSLQKYPSFLWGKKTSFLYKFLLKCSFLHLEQSDSNWDVGKNGVVLLLTMFI